MTIVSVVFFVMDAYVNDDLDDPTSWDLFWKVAFLPLMVLLYGSQLYACKILYLLAKKCKQNFRKLEKVVEDATKTLDPNECSRLVRGGTCQSRIDHQEMVDNLDAFENHCTDSTSIHMSPRRRRSSTSDIAHMVVTVGQQLSLRRQSLVDCIFPQDGAPLDTLQMSQNSLGCSSFFHNTPNDVMDELVNQYIMELREGLQDPKRRSTILRDVVFSEVNAKKIAAWNLEEMDLEDDASTNKSSNT